VKDNEELHLTDNIRRRREMLLTAKWEVCKADVLFRCPDCGRTWGYRNHIMFNGRGRCPDCGQVFNKPDEVSDDTLKICTMVKEHGTT
jgi:predicted RNA-binding Zn-ribbon protein involved in translation (DUF1610 family)